MACAGGAAVQDGSPLGWVLVAGGLLAGIFVLVLTAATAETFHLVVYRYATQGDVAGTFTEQELAHDAMRHRGAGVTGWFRRVSR